MFNASNDIGRITTENFEDFIHGMYDYDPASDEHNGLFLCASNADIGGGRIKISDIDELKKYPRLHTVGIAGLRQDTFEYFISTYGAQLRAIRFFKNKFIEDLSPLAHLPQLEYVYFFANQRVERLWDMRGNTCLKGLALDDFTRLHDVSLAASAPALEYFHMGDGIWPTSVVESYACFAHTHVKHLSFSGKAIRDTNLSFLTTMSALETFDCPTNLFTTEQIAWVVANCPHLSGYALKAMVDFHHDDQGKAEEVVIVGKRKPFLYVAGNEARIKKYADKFAHLVDTYAGVPYEVAFPPEG